HCRARQRHAPDLGMGLPRASRSTRSARPLPPPRSPRSALPLPAPRSPRSALPLPTPRSPLPTPRLPLARSSRSDIAPAPSRPRRAEWGCNQPSLRICAWALSRTRPASRRSSMLNRRSILTSMTAAGVVGAVAACSPSSDDGGSGGAGDSDGGGEGTLTFRLWDENAVPAYEESFQAFTEQHGWEVEIDLVPWGDYWTRL